LPEKAFRRRKAGRYSVKKSVLFERVASLRILGILSGFSAFGGFGPRLFVTFGVMPKVKPFLVFQDYLICAKPKDCVSGFSYYPDRAYLFFGRAKHRRGQEARLLL
jgi:hypothetical protein